MSSVISDISLGLGLLSSLNANVDVVGIYSNGAGQGGVASSSGYSGLSASVLSSILGTVNTTASIGQLFTQARPLKATVRETSKVMEHPVETGVTLSDHHIINPVEIEIPLFIPSKYYAAIYSQIRQAFINATPLAVKTRVGVYGNMIIAEMPHDEQPEMFDAIVVTLRLRQAIYAVPGTNIGSTNTLSNFQPLDPLNSNTIASGLQQATSLSSQLFTSASGVATYLSLLGGKKI